MTWVELNALLVLALETSQATGAITGGSTNSGTDKTSIGLTWDHRESI